MSLSSVPDDDNAAPLKLDLVIGTRPNIVKAGPLFNALRNERWCEVRVVFLMQHTEPALAEQSLQDVGIDLTAVLGLPLEQTNPGLRLGEMLARYSVALTEDRPDLVLVFGDVDTTLAATYAAKRAHIPVAHVEAGLRSYDHTMPEELNRLMVDAICDMHLATSREAVRNLVEKEGHDPAQVHFVGNLMIDALLRTIDDEHGKALCQKHQVAPGQFALATFHRPSNVDNGAALTSLLSVIRSAAQRLPLLLPLHPRTRAAFARHGYEEELGSIPGLHILSPLRYRDFVSLLSCARVVLTDSGGLQEETSVLGIPCLTLRANTERPITLEQGSNRLAEPETLGDLLDSALREPRPPRAVIEGWDGHAATRILDVIMRWANERASV